MIARHPATDNERPIQNDARGRLRKTNHDRKPTNTGVLLPSSDATAAPVYMTAVFQRAMSSAKKTPPSTAIACAVLFLREERGPALSWVRRLSSLHGISTAPATRTR
jgi:hypothetical protein